MYPEHLPCHKVKRLHQRHLKQHELKSASNFVVQEKPLRCGRDSFRWLVALINPLCRI